MPFKVFTNTTLTSADVNDYLMEQAVIQATSTTRPSSPHEGMLVAETDTNRFSAYSGTAWVPMGSWGAFTSTTPNLVQSSGVAKTVNHAVHVQLGKLVVYFFRMTVNTGSFGVASNPVTVTLPVTAARADMTVGVGGIYDSSAALGYSGSTFLVDTGTLDFRLHGSGTAPDNRLGMAGFTAALGQNDIITGFAIYEAA